MQLSRATVLLSSGDYFILCPSLTDKDYINRTLLEDSSFSDFAYLYPVYEL